MEQYHKIQTVFKRDPETNFKTVLIGDYSKPEFFYLRDNLWEFTEKIDGTNIRVMWKDGKVFFGGKTDRANMNLNLINRLTLMFRQEELKAVFPDYDACLYGEGYGAGIQKVGSQYIKKGVSFILFDVKVGNVWLQRSDVAEIADKLQVRCAPVIGYGTLVDMVDASGVKNAGTFGSMIADCQAEGIVARPAVELVDRRGNRIITKIKVADFNGI